MNNPATSDREQATPSGKDDPLVESPANRPPSLPVIGPGIPERNGAEPLWDRIRPSAIRAMMVIIPCLLTWLTWTYCLSLDKGGMQFISGIVGIILAGFSMTMVVAMTMECWNDPRSLVNRGRRRLPRRKGIATAAADMVRRDWHRSTIATSPGIDAKDAGRVVGMRSTIVILPSGAGIKIVHRYHGTPLVILEPDGQKIAVRNQKVETTQALGTAASLHIAAEVEKRQIETLAMRLGIVGAVSAQAMTRMLAALATGEPEEMPYKSLPSAGENDWVKRIHQLPADVMVTTVGVKNSTKVHECLVTAPGVGVLSLPTYGFGDEMSKAKASRMAKAFGIQQSKHAHMPIFIGNARATRLAELAQRGLDEDPDLVDSDGNRIGPLFQEHLPRLIDKHRASMRTSGAERISEIDAELDHGLDIIARALGQALDRLADQRQDDLRTEVRFLEARHHEQARI